MNLKRILTISLFAVVAVVIFIINTLVGNPISKKAAQEQYLKYFESTYKEKFVVYDSDYNPKIPDYVFEIGPADDKNIRFDTALYGMGVADEYGGILAASKLSKDVGSIMQKPYGFINYEIKAREDPLIGYAGEVPDYFETNTNIRLRKNHYLLDIIWSDTGANTSDLRKIAEGMEGLIESRLPYCTPNLTVNVSLRSSKGEEIVSLEGRRLLFSTIEDPNKNSVANLAMDLGRKFKLVSLLAPTEAVRTSMQENFASYVTTALLEKWQNDPLNAPGRSTSSPWPDRISILTNTKIDEVTYEVKGDLIEITSLEQGSNEDAAKRPITLIIKRINNQWLADAMTLGDYLTPESIVYVNRDYGFSFTLPASWQNYTFVIEKWEGISLAAGESGKVATTGQTIKIRHPLWSTQAPRQDIPIMIFSISQWQLIQNEQISVGAAPIPPSELGRNSRYIFALPARYNYSFPKGFEEVEGIIAKNPLHPDENYDPDDQNR